MNQLSFPSDVTPQEIARKHSLGGAIELCAEAGGKEPKDIMDKLRADKAQWSRWKDDHEGLKWDKFTVLMDYCGNDAPLLWMLQQRGYDLASLRKQESETEKKLRLALEEITRLKSERETELRFARELRVAA